MACQYCAASIKRIKMKRQWIHYVDYRIIVCEPDAELHAEWTGTRLLSGEYVARYHRRPPVTDQ